MVLVVFTVALCVLGLLRVAVALLLYVVLLRVAATLLLEVVLLRVAWVLLRVACVLLRVAETEFREPFTVPCEPPVRSLCFGSTTVAPLEFP